MIILNGKRIDGIVGDTLPIGTISAYVGLVAPKGYLLCQGQLVDKVKYLELYNLCGDTFGTATTTQFYLPDLQNKVIGGYKPNDDIFGTFGSSVGAKSVTTGNHTLTTDEIPSHRHAYWHSNSATDLHVLTIDQIPSHTHSILRGTAGDSWFGFSSREVQNPPYSGNTEATGGGQGHQHSLGGYWDWSSYECGSGAHNHGDVTVVQPTIVLNWIIKAFTIVPNQSEVVNLISQSSIDVYSASFVNDLLEQMKRETFDFAHPVGSYYETSNANWTPSSAGWYGTWVEDTAGKTTVAQDTGTFKTLGSSIGAESRDISHSHSLSDNGHAKMTLHGSGKLCYHELSVPAYNSTFYIQGSGGGGESETDTWGTGLGGSTDNKSLSCNVIQPSVVVRRWHRTA